MPGTGVTARRGSSVPRVAARAGRQNHGGHWCSRFNFFSGRAPLFLPGFFIGLLYFYLAVSLRFGYANAGLLSENHMQAP